MPDDYSDIEPTFYKILGLTSRPPSDLFQRDVKAAYHRALLRYHPDKINASMTAKKHVPQQSEEFYTVDQIAEAYNTLASPVTRAAYDKELELSPTGTIGKFKTEKLHNGVEVHDLEDLVYNEDSNVWSRGCRCGDPQGYVVTEAELERESNEGDIYVACKGCSLWIKVLFDTTESDCEMGEEGVDQQQNAGGTSS